MIIQRTIANYLANKIDNLAVFKDDLAWQDSVQYPYMLTSLTGSKRDTLGTGIRDFKTESDETKVYYNETQIRLTFRAVSTNEKNGNELVCELVRQSDELLRQLTRVEGITLIDTETSIPIRVAYTEYQSETDIQVIDDKLPVVYQKAITYLFRIVDPSVLSIESVPVENLQVTI
jgi:hypothetical protein